MIERLIAWHDWPIATKLAIVLAVLAVGPLTFVAFYNDASMRAELLAATRAQNWQRARGTAQVLDAYLLEGLDDIRVIALASDAVRFLQDQQDERSRAEVNLMLRQARETHRFDALYLTDQSGNVLFATDERLVGRNYVTARWLLNAIAGQTSFDEPRYDPELGQVYLHFSTPVRAPEGLLLGTVIGRISMDAIDQIVAADSDFSGRGDFGVLWDDLGIRLSHGRRPDLRFKPFAPLSSDVASALIAEARFGPATGELLAGASQIPEITGRSKLLLYDREADPYLRFISIAAAGPVEAAVVPLEHKRWLYGVITPEAGILSTLNAQTQRSLLAALAVGLLAVFAALVAARWTTRPIRQVAETADAIAAGDVARRVGLRQRDEVGRLAAAFDAMADALAEKEAQLRDYAGQLEQMMQERTAELQHRANEFAALYETTRDLAAQQDLSALLQTIVERASALLDVPYGAVYLYDAARRDLELVVSKELSLPLGTRLKPGEGMAGRVTQTREPLIVDDYRTWEGRSPQYEGKPFTSVVEVPMLFRGEMIGVLAVFGADAIAPKFTDADARLLTLFAAHAASVVHNARLFEETRRHLNELFALYNASLVFGQLLSPEVIGQKVIETLERSLDWQRGSIWLISESGQELYLLAHSDMGLSPEAFQAELARVRSLVTRPGQGISGWVALHGEPVRSGDVRSDPRYIEADPAIHSELCVPLKVGGRTIGSINVESFQPDAFSEHDEWLLTTLASQVASAIENARLYQEVQRHAAELEQRVQERTAELQAANRELEAFSYSVSHDLRAPLRAIDGFSRILFEKHAPQLQQEAQRYLGLVRDNARQMGQLIDDLLAFSRLSRQPLKTQPVAVADLVCQVIESLRAEWEGRRVEIVIGDPSAGSACPGPDRHRGQALPTCQADPALLRQVFFNLLSNALKFTRTRDVARIEVGSLGIADLGGVETKSEISNLKSAIYFVRDNGVGFDMRYADKLFGVFQRLHRAEEYEGTGVGLAIVQRIIHRHGGRVWAEAEVDKGATFYFTI